VSRAALVALAALLALAPPAAAETASSDHPERALAVASASRRTKTGPTVDAAVTPGTDDTPADAPADAQPWIRPFVAVVGGLEIETLVNRPGDNREGRAVTVALSRFGMRAGVAKGIYIESEFEANAGPHGSSAWEGQAALSVRNQLVRIERGRFRADAGRITDPASLDFVSDHVLDQLLTDGFTRGALLASGFNRGNGVLGQVELIPGGRLGLSVNAANPVSTTSSLVVGGTFPPFARFYFAPYQYVGRDAANFPADEYHFVMVTPSALLDRERFAVHAALQMFQVNTNTSRRDDQHIDGYNARVTAMARFLDRRLRAFGSASIVQNEVVDPDDGTRLSGELYTGTSVGGGLDVDAPPIGGRRAGAGVQLSLVRDRQGARALADQLFVNVGTTYWLGETTALGARFALYRRCEDLEGDGCTVDGERSFFMTLRTQI